MRAALQRLKRAARFAKILGRSPEQFLRLSLQELIDEAGLKMRVNVDAVETAISSSTISGAAHETQDQS